MKRALIIGPTGQDGSYLAELLLDKGYEVHGLVRRSSSPNTSRIDHLLREPANLTLHYGDLNDGSAIRRVLDQVQPHEIYNLGAQSHVGVSFDIPEYTGDVTGLGVMRLLEAVRQMGLQTRVYQASSSELYGKVIETPQRETTPFYPRSPYACAKAYAYHIARNYREAHGMFVCNGILFNHESERRGEQFVTRKITRAAGRIKAGLQDKLYLGNLDALRDWGHAADYVEAMWMMLQQPEPEDFVIGTGETHSVREFLELTFARLGLNPDDHVRIDPRFIRPSEVDLLLADPSKAREKLGWTPRTDFRTLVNRMVDHDLMLARRERYISEWNPTHEVAETRVTAKRSPKVDVRRDAEFSVSAKNKASNAA